MNVRFGTALAHVNEKLYNHVAWMIPGSDPEKGEDGHVLLNEQQKERVLNIGQDITATINGITTPTCKHIGTALYLLKETRSKSLVTMFNHFGNCINYSDAQRCIAAMAEMVSDREDEGGVFIPNVNESQ